MGVFAQFGSFQGKPGTACTKGDGIFPQILPRTRSGSPKKSAPWEYTILNSKLWDLPPDGAIVLPS